MVCVKILESSHEPSPAKATTQLRIMLIPLSIHSNTYFIMLMHILLHFLYQFLQHFAFAMVPNNPQLHGALCVCEWCDSPLSWGGKDLSRLLFSLCIASSLIFPPMFFPLQEWSHPYKLPPSSFLHTTSMATLPGETRSWNFYFHPQSSWLE